MKTLNLLYKTQIDINDAIHIRIPTVGEVLDDEDGYYGLVQVLTAMPIDMMVQLDDIGIDFSKIDDYELFIMLFGGLRSQDTSMVFGDLDLSKFEPAKNEQNGQVVLIDREHDIVIDKLIHDKIATVLRRLHHLEKDIRKPGNDEAKRYMIEKARVKQRRERNRSHESQIESLIVAMVNTEQFKYNFEEVRGLSIYSFNESVRQIIKKVAYDNKMHGVYAGTVSVKDLNKDELNWLNNK